MDLRAAGVSARVVADDGFLQVVSLLHDGEELLVDSRDLPASATVHGRCAGITFLPPWANRLYSDSFDVAGARVSLDGGPAISRDAEGRALHGLPGRWKLLQTSPASLA